MKNELESIRWLGFALTEAVAFYTFIFGLIAFFLSRSMELLGYIAAIPLAAESGRRGKRRQLPGLARASA